MKYRILILFCLIRISLNAQIVKLDSSNLPICIIDTRGKTIANEPKILAHMKIIDNGPGKINKVKDTKFNYNNFIAIEIRGNSSQFYPQKQYGIELRDSVSGADLDAGLMGMPAEEDWILYAPYNDISMLRNVLTYNLWNAMGHWGPRTRFCELLINNEYVGIYILTESIKRGAERVAIAKLNPEDTSGLELTGGYIMKIDKNSNSADLGFVSKVKSTTNLDINWLHHYPDSNDIKPKQQKYIQNFIDTVELLIASAGFADPIKGYKKYISVNSFIDYFLITEFSRNIDAYKASSFFYKEKLEADGSKGMLKAGPVWDYNFAFGNASFCSGAQTAGWMYDGCVPATIPTPILWRRLLTDTNYANAVKCRYLELRKTLLDTGSLFQYLNRYAFDTLDAAQKRHYTKWKILGTNPGGFNAYIASSYPDELNRLKNWIRNRLNWMDANLPGRCIPAPVIVKIEMPLDPECFQGIRPVIEKSHPFNISPFNYNGTEKIANIPSDIIRWVLVELRDSKDSTKIIDRRAALLRIDSVLLDTNLNVGVLFPKAIDKNQYFILVRYDSLGFLFSKEAVQVPNDNDYNLNRTHRLNTIANTSPLIYNTNWLGVDTLKVCQGQSVYLSDSNLVKLGYSFVGHQILLKGANLSIPNPHELEVQIDSSGAYPVDLYLDCNDHSIVRSSIILIVNQNPTAKITGPNTFCPGDTIELQSDQFASYEWSTNEVKQSIFVDKQGTYQLTVTDGNGCSSKAIKEVLQHPLLKGKIISESTTATNKCKLYFLPEDPNSNYRKLWSTGEQTDTIVTSDLTVQLTVTDSNQCSQVFVFICNPVSLNETTIHHLQIHQYPNRGSVKIYSPETFERLALYDASGILVYSKKWQTNEEIHEIQLNNLTSGIYFGITQLGDRRINFKMFVE
ncbi:MAG: CotH kinase family protein [Saprospiraceae bacterium]|nr:CotH kinase family protein [Saprospiraceae bacterium]